MPCTKIHLLPYHRTQGGCVASDHSRCHNAAARSLALPLEGQSNPKGPIVLRDRESAGRRQPKGLSSSPLPTPHSDSQDKGGRNFWTRPLIIRLGEALLLAALFLSRASALIVDGGGGGGGGVTCSNGFQPAANNPLTCVCPSPKTVCGLSCGAFSACQSGIPVVRRAADKAHIDMLPRTSRIGNKALCPSRKTPCGIPNKGFQAWECVDTESDLFSCGGCAMSGPFGQGMKRGRDCSTIEGTAAVRCEGGRCVVESCMGGYVPSKNVSACTMKGNEEEGALEGALRGGLKSIFGVGV